MNPSSRSPFGQPYPEDDFALVSRVQSGDAGAFQALVDRHYGSLFGLAFSLTGDFDDAEDVAQSSLVKVYRKLAQYTGRGCFAAWIAPIVRSTAKDLHRSRQRRAEIQRRRLLQADGLSGTASASDDLDRKRLMEVVLGCYMELPDRQREVFGMADLQGLPAVQIAEALGIDPASVRTHLLRARRTIRSKILEHHPELVEGL